MAISKLRVSCQCVYVIGVILLSHYYLWDRLLDSLEGSVFKAGLIVSCMVVFGLVNVNDLVGQPEKDHDHDD